MEELLIFFEKRKSHRQKFARLLRYAISRQPLAPKVFKLQTEKTQSQKIGLQPSRWPGESIWFH